METPRELALENILVELTIDGKVEGSDHDLGAVRMECEGRTYILDVLQSYSDFEEGKQ
jgi:hypothetical protein